MKKDRKGGGVCCEDNDFGDTAIQSLGRFVGTFFELAKVRGLLDQIKNFLSEGGVCDRPGWERCQ